MSDIDDLLAAINVRKCKFAQAVSPPASPEAIERLRRFARDTLRTDLPEGHVRFLGRNDGLAFNNCEIYAATEKKKPYLPGFVETNEILGEGDDRFVYYGGTSNTLYGQDRTSMAWVALDVPSLDVMDTFPSFDAMLAQVLRESLQGRTDS
jgi:hypothetical protein